MAATDKIDTANHFRVGAVGNLITIGRAKSPMTREEALNLAAYLVLLADDGSFPKLLEAVRNA